MLTDGNATAYQSDTGGLKNIPPQALYKIADDGQKTLPKKARLHTIYYLNAKEKKTERDSSRRGMAGNSKPSRRKAADRDRRRPRSPAPLARLVSLTILHFSPPAPAA